MRFQRAFLAAVFLGAFGLTGCNSRSPTEPAGPPVPVGLSGPDKYSLTTTMTNTSGAATLSDGQILIDNVVVADSCPNADLNPEVDGDGNIIGYFCTKGASTSAILSAAGAIGPGSHTLRFFISEQTTAYAPTPYTVAAFTIGVRDTTGKLLKSVNLPAQTANLKVGDSMIYLFTI